MSVSYWNGEYRSGRRIWGELPGELAQAAVKYVREAGYPTAGKRLLDIGCGYGRDAFFLASRWDMSVTGVDSSEQAVELAESESAKGKLRGVEFRCGRFQDISDGPFDMVYAANLYQILPAPERRDLCRAVDALLAPAGLFFLSTLSSRDPEHAGKGTPVPGEPHSWVEKTYIHLSDRKELEEGFRFLAFQRFYEHEFLEPRSGGANHHHISWVLVGARSAAGPAGG